MTGKIISIEKKRQEKKLLLKREFERVLFHNVLGVYASAEYEGKWVSCDIIDISPSGCLLEIGGKKVPPDESELTLRFYFTADHYIIINGFIKHAHLHKNATVRCGLQFNKTTKSFKALASFIEFIYHLAEHATTDQKLGTHTL